MRFQAFTLISSPALHSWLFRANQIRYDPIKAILPNAPFNFFKPLIPMWLQIDSRFTAFRWLITPLYLISRGRLRLILCQPLIPGSFPF